MQPLTLERLALHGAENALDLYSGVGMFIAERAARVTAVEAYAPALHDAEANLAGMNNVELRQGTIERVLPALKGRFDAAVVDPPRSGMNPKALSALVGHQPQTIVYVSCDPTTLARDAKQLVADGYQLLDAQPVDMFPQTYHVETVATFKRRESGFG